ncbi:Uncharacterised protein [Mycobacterium tuberculosis]|nr:Uncharacterised protein [Mycobacterium tuberculosis]
MVPSVAARTDSARATAASRTAPSCHFSKPAPHVSANASPGSSP